MVCLETPAATQKRNASKEEQSSNAWLGNGEKSDVIAAGEQTGRRVGVVADLKRLASGRSNEGLVREIVERPRDRVDAIVNDNEKPISRLNSGRADGKNQVAAAERYRARTDGAHASPDRK